MRSCFRGNDWLARGAREEVYPGREYIDHLQQFGYGHFMEPRYWSLGLFLSALLAVEVALADGVDDYLRQEMAKRQIPGAALAVIQNGKTVKTAAYGLANVEHQVAVKPETVFEIGSLTKQFTAAGILLLAQEGKLGLDDPIRRHLQSAPETWQAITVRHLLTHTSGLKSYTGLAGFELRQHLTQAQFIQAIGKQPPDFAPGQAWKYCNTGYNLLGYILENLSGGNYWDFMSARIFQPLGMNSTTNRQPRLIIPNRAAGYEHKNKMLMNRDADLTDVFSAGALVSTVGDLAKWNAALDSEVLLKAQSKEAMWSSAALHDGKPAKYGFGWFLSPREGHANIGHSGSTSGFSASLQRFPDDHLAVILLTNTDEGIATTLAGKVATFYFPPASQ